MRASVTRRQILSQALVKAYLVLMVTTVGNSGHPARVKAETFLLGELFPMVSRKNIVWNYQGVLLLISMEGFGKYTHTRLNLTSAGLLV